MWVGRVGSGSSDRRLAGPCLMAMPTAMTMAREKRNQRRKVRRDEGSTQSVQGKRWGSCLGLVEGLESGVGIDEGIRWAEACGGESQCAAL